MPILEAFLVVGVVAAAAFAPAVGGDVVDAPAALEASRAGEAALVDIRRPEEWLQTGMPEGAVGVTWGEPDFVERMRAAVGGDPGRPVILICRTGNRTTHAMAELRRHGFGAVVHVGEGMAGSGHGPGWLARALPVRPPR